MEDFYKKFTFKDFSVGSTYNIDIGGVSFIINSLGVPFTEDTKTGVRIFLPVDVTFHLNADGDKDEWKTAGKILARQTGFAIIWNNTDEPEWLNGQMGAAAILGLKRGGGGRRKTRRVRKSLRERKKYSRHKRLI